MLARKSTLIMTTDIIEALLAYVSLFFIARYMGPGDYGIIGFAMGFVGLFTFLSKLGFDEAHIKHISDGKDLGTCIGTFLVTKLGLVSLMVAVTVGAVFFWKLIIGRGFESSTHEMAIFIILGYFILERISNIFRVTFTAEKKIAKIRISRLISAITRVGAIIFVAVSDLGPIALAFCYVFGNIFLFAASLLLFRKHPIKKPSKEYFKSYSRFAMPLIFASVSAVIMTNIDKVLIQLFWASEEVGYYFASLRICEFIVLAGTSMGLLLFPTISEYHSKKSVASIKNVLHLSERYISMLTFPMVMGLIALAGPSAYILLSSSFSPSISVFRILPFFALLYALSIPFNAQFLGMGKPKLARNRVLIMICFNVILNIILIPKDIQSLGIKLFGLGASGAAIATVVSYLVGLIYCRYFSWRLIKFKFNFRILLHLFAATIMAVILYWIDVSGVVPIERWYELFVVGVLGLGIYIGILIILREFTRKDFNFIMDTLNIKKMWKYIIKEIKR